MHTMSSSGDVTYAVKGKAVALMNPTRRLSTTGRRLSQSVSCGRHRSASCSACTKGKVGHGKEWCFGDDCKWEKNKCCPVKGCVDGVSCTWPKRAETCDQCVTGMIVNG